MIVKEYWGDSSTILSRTVKTGNVTKKGKVLIENKRIHFFLQSLDR